MHKNEVRVKQGLGRLQSSQRKRTVIDAHPERSCTDEKLKYSNCCCKPRVQFGETAINLTTKAYLMEAEVEGGLRHPTQVEALL